MGFIQKYCARDRTQYQLKILERIFLNISIEICNFPEKR
jgi:hypothetical protein